ncbi:MAG: type II toxin-antitoxin system VapB family antitoxin [Cyclobacterium sp.]|uniref:type II toxin-antitoxin system VapB family antitoxin n=1 Tax=unclassified Cyclobacterium TaxID=2615055 RepID=UPI0013D896E5|nr:type II toxin-antitoxin system VapB family antitoxin [Cyclobacterium sp. SYSU L10401]
MRTNIEIDDKLMDEILNKTSLKTKREIVHAALKDFLQKLKREELAGMAGKIDWVEDLERMRTD